MLKIRIIHHIIFVGLTLLVANQSFAQKFADKEYFLIDSLVLEDLTKEQRKLIDSCLSIYHTTERDTDKVNVLFNWYDNISYTDPSTSFKVLSKIERLSNKNLKLSINSSEKLFFMTSLSSALNDQGFYLAEILVELDSALVLFQKSLQIKLDLKDNLSIATSYNNIGYVYDIKGEITTAISYYEKSLNILETIGHSAALSTCLRNLSDLYYYQGNEELALNYTKRSLMVAKSIADSHEIASCYMYYANYYTDKGDIKSALEYYHKTLKIVERIEDTEVLVDVLSSVGTIYAQYLGDYQTGLSYFKKALKTSEMMKYSEGIAINLNNIGFVYDKNGDKELALTYYKKSLKIDEDNENIRSMISSLRNVGALYEDLGKNKEALNYYLKSLEMAERVGNKIAKAKCLNNISSLYFKNGNLKKAKINAIEANSIANKYKNVELISFTSFILSKIYQNEGEWFKALEMYQTHIITRDSINNIEIQKLSIRKQTKYEYEKQKSLDDLQNEKLVAIEKEEKEKQTLITFATAGGLGVTSIFLFIIFNRLRITRKQKIIIEEQNVEVESQKKEAENQRDIANTQKIIVEEKNKEILESITYAKRIQEAILPPPRLVKEWLTESFIFYKPKDIVAGDFYWMETASFNEGGKEKTLVYFAAADCTGHGVPGAMVSVVCANALNKAIKEFNLIEPGHVLDKVTELVIEAFEKSEEEIKDGMDIALCAMDISAKKIYYSGANNPLYRITSIKTKVEPMTNAYANKTHQLIEYKATKQPVGYYENLKQFDTIEIQLEPGDAVYLFSDGFADQFGGEKGKKYKYSSFRQCLLENFNHPMEIQKQMLEKEFKTWKGELEQVDDVCVIGVKINGVEKNNFTQRELEVLQYLQEGLPSKLIADKMNISKHTVDTYRRRLLAKTGAYNATELINYCIKKEII